MTDPKTVRLKLTLAYQGARFKGWQVQNRSTGPHGSHRTVQGCVEEAMAKVLGRPARVVGSSRTDTGVHALGQCAHVDVDQDKAGLDWQKILNALLPKDVCVTSLTFAPTGFHALCSAVSKTYSYSLWLSSRYVLPQRRAYVWPVGPLDLDAMQAAADLLAGEHDFASFRNLGTETKTTVRTLQPVQVQHDSAEETRLLFSANGFLKQMVRNLTGCLVEVGRGKLAPEQVGDILTVRDRTKAPATAPPQGLTLLRVCYGDDAAP